MSYPKPLTEKTLKRKYDEAGITEKKSEFLHDFFQSAANLYGTYSLRDIWEIYKDTAENYEVSNLKRKDFIAFSSIARREEVGYYVFEIDELFSMEKRSDLSRIIVLKSLVSSGYGKLVSFYTLEEAQAYKPYFIPENILDYLKDEVIKEETELLEHLKELKVTLKESVNEFGNPVKCENFGKRLGEFPFLNEDERFELKYYSGEFENHPSRNDKVIAEVLKLKEMTAAEKLVFNLKREINIGYSSTEYLYKRFFRELTEIGVAFSIDEVNKLATLLTNFNNYSHLMCNRGFRPIDLAPVGENMIPDYVSFGPGIKKAIADGSLNYNELKDKLNEMGIKIEGI